MGSLDMLLADLERARRLTRAEEVALAKRVERGDQAARDPAPWDRLRWRAEAGAATGFDPEAQMIDGERRAVLAHAVAGLAPRERDIVRQHFGLAGARTAASPKLASGSG